MDAAARPTDSAPAFHAEDVDQVADYRSVSVLALLSLLIGLTSPLILVSRLFLILPLLGAALSLIALRRIATSSELLAGRWAATAGLALCVACGIAAFSRDGVTRYMRTTQAEEFGREWLLMLASNETEQAFRMTVEGARPAAPREPGMPPAATTPYDQFMNDPLVQEISTAGANANVAFLETQEYSVPSRRDFIVRQRFQITPYGDAGNSDSSTVIEAVVTLQRSRFPGQRQPRWLVVKFEAPSATAN
ncbi:MAG: hypothetical protein L0228_09360 [Planctomycetes bacterium]|nr:hypothetical protein [Planctomycetota bacterium]